MGYQGQGLEKLIRGMTNIALDAFEEELTDTPSLQRIDMLRRMVNLGNVEERQLAEEQKKRNGNRKNVRKLLREKPKVREIGELEEDGTGVIDVEFVEVKDEK